MYQALAKLRKTAPLDCLVLFLMCEDFLGPKSSVAAYIASLPRTFSNPLYHSLLTNTTCESGDEDVDSLLAEQRGKYLASWKNVSLTVVNNPTCLKGVFTEDRFLWAWFAVATRFLYIDKQKPALVPFVDLLNHSPHVQVCADCRKCLLQLLESNIETLIFHYVHA